MSLTVYCPVATDALITRLQVTLSSGTFPTRTLEIWRTPFHINCSLLPLLSVFTPYDKFLLVSKLKAIYDNVTGKGCEHEEKRGSFIIVV
jgi:hypothetical protein